MGYVSNTYNDYSELIDAIEAEAVIVGWGATVVNAATGNPGFGQLGRETILTPPGDAVRAAGGYVGFAHLLADDNFNPYVTLCCWGSTGIRVLPNITALDVNANVATLVFDAAHGLANGDLINWNGNADPENNRAVLLTQGVTVVNPTTVTVPCQGNVANTTAPAAGGTAWQVFNQTLYRTFAAPTVNGNGRVRLPTPGGNFTARFVVTEFAIAGIITQANSNHPFFAGLPGLEDVQALQSSVGKLTVQVVSDGVTPSVMSLDRNMDNSYVDGTVRVIPQDRLGPTTTLNNRECEYPGATITAKPSATQITAVIPAGTYPIGSLVGFDPMPINAGSISGGNAPTQVIGSCTHRSDGSRVAGYAESHHAVYLVFIVDDALNPARGPNPSTQYGGGEAGLVSFWDTASYNFVRYGLRPFVHFVVGPQNDFDIMRIGPAAEAPDHDWSICPSLTLGGRALTVGPGAT